MDHNKKRKCFLLYHRTMPFILSSKNTNSHARIKERSEKKSEMQFIERKLMLRDEVKEREREKRNVIICI